MLIFNGVETAQYDRSFQFVGNNFNFRNVDTLTLNGRFAYTPEGTDKKTAAAGLTFVSGDGAWSSFTGSGHTSIGYDGTEDGYFYTDGGANIWVNGGGVLDSYFKSLAYTSLHVTDIWDDMDTVINTFHDWQEIVVEGVSMGSGVVKSINFPSSSDATQRKYSVTVEIPQEGDLDSLQGVGMNGISLDASELAQAQSITENFSVSRNKNGQVEMSRSLSANVIDGPAGNSMDVARSIAQGLINNADPLLDIVAYPSFYSTADKVYSETYDEIRGEYSWEETLIKSDDDKQYYWSYGHTFQQNENGVISVAEAGEVMGLTSDRYLSAKQGWAEAETNIKTRVENFYNTYNTGEAGNLGLIGSSVIRNEVEGAISYENSYSDDPFERACVRWSHTTDFNRDASNNYFVSERGEVLGRCGDNYTGRFATASGFFTDEVQPGIKPRAQSLFDTVKTGACVNNLTDSQHDITYSQFNSSVGYNYSFTDRDTSLDNSDFRATRTISVAESVPTVGFHLTPYNGEIAQYQKQSEMVQESQTITLHAKSAGKSHLDFLTRAKALLVEPEGIVYKSNTEYSFNPEEDAMTLSVVYRYPGSRTRNQADV